MKSIQIYLQFFCKYRYPILLLLFLVWMCVGIFPLHCYEGDSLHTIAGCEVLCNQGFALPPVYHYEYNMQPLIYYVVAGACHILPFMSCEEIFCLLTGIVAALNVIAGIGFIHRLTGIRREWILFAMFLLPESVAIGMYPNTAIFAMFPFVLALNCLLHKRLKTAIVWMCLAPLFRIDILMVYPVILSIFLWQKDSFATALKKSILSAGVIVAVTVLCYWLLQANPLDSTLNSYEKWNESISLAKNFYAVFSFYTALGILLFLGGVFQIARRKDWLLLAVVLVPVVLNHVIYGRMGCATKHYLYILPFVALAISVFLVYLNNWLESRKILKYASWGALAVFLFVSLRISPPGRPWYTRGVAQSAAYLPVWHETLTPLKFSVGIGAGFPIATADERMLASGNFFYPFYIHLLKTQRAESRAMACEHLDSLQRYTLLGISWENMILLPTALQAEGWTFEVEKNDDLRKFILHSPGGEKRAVVIAKEIAMGDKSPDMREKMLKDYIQRLSMEGAPYYLFTCTNSTIYFFDRFTQEGLAEKISDGLYLVLPQQNKNAV